MLQAFIDDSKSDREVLVLAGYIATAERWTAFSDKWRELLSMQPSWKRFKMKDVQYQNSDMAWDRAKAHYHIIREHVIADICIAVPIRPLIQAVDDFQLPSWWRNPYWLAWKSIISAYLGNIKKIEIDQPVDFIFDDQTEKRHVLAAWDGLYRNVPQRYKRLIPNPPTFQTDDAAMPLQAADLIAWWTRKRYVEKGTILEFGPLVPWEASDPGHAHLYGELSPETVRFLLKEETTPKMRVSTSFVLRPRT